MSGEPAAHVPVMPAEVLDWLAVQPAGTYVDCTAGAGGHAALVAARLREGRLLALDRDPAAVALARARLADYPRACVVNANYGELQAVLSAHGIAEVDGILLDAGTSSMQLDTPARGFSFQQSGPLDMRMDTARGRTAAEFLRETDQAALEAVLRNYGDLKPARRIARAILDRRDAAQMETTDDLVAAAWAALPMVQQVPEEVRTVFQAIRMAVNEELQHLETGLCQGLGALAPGGRMVVIAFHSGEDRVVKQTFAAHSRKRTLLHPDGRVREVIPPRFRLLTPKPVQPGADETRNNPRAKSAKLRAIARIAQGDCEHARA